METDVDKIRRSYVFLVETGTNLKMLKEGLEEGDVSKIAVALLSGIFYFFDKKDFDVYNDMKKVIRDHLSSKYFDTVDLLSKAFVHLLPKLEKKDAMRIYSTLKTYIGYQEAFSLYVLNGIASMDVEGLGTILDKLFDLNFFFFSSNSYWDEKMTDILQTRHFANPVSIWRRQPKAFADLFCYLTNMLICNYSSLALLHYLFKAFEEMDASDRERLIELLPEHYGAFLRHTGASEPEVRKYVETVKQEIMFRGGVGKLSLLDVKIDDEYLVMLTEHREDEKFYRIKVLDWSLRGSLLDTVKQSLQRMYPYLTKASKKTPPKDEVDLIVVTETPDKVFVEYSKKEYESFFGTYRKTLTRFAFKKQGSTKSVGIKPTYISPREKPFHLF